MYFPDTRSGALTSSTLSQKAFPIAAGIVAAAVACALLNRWLAQKAERRNPPLGRFITVDGVRIFPEEMAVRPSQIRASAAESALMIPSAHTLGKQYRLLQIPVAIVAGADDRLIESEQSAHLHRDIPHSTLRCVPGTGHMVHQTATEEIMTAIDMVAAQNRKPVAATSAA